MRQMTIDELPIRLVPDDCPYREDVPSIGHVLCHKDGKEVYTDCTKSMCGDPPHCAWEEPDNSPEAKRRRVDWMRKHKEET